jgi:hypothetical protein
MIRFVDLSKVYWTDPEENGGPACAFLDTITDRFVALNTGDHALLFEDEIDFIPDMELRDRCRGLVPEGFWSTKR